MTANTNFPDQAWDAKNARLNGGTGWHPVSGGNSIIIRSICYSTLTECFLCRLAPKFGKMAKFRLFGRNSAIFGREQNSSGSYSDSRMPGLTSSYSKFEFFEYLLDALLISLSGHHCARIMAGNGAQVHQRRPSPQTTFLSGKNGLRPPGK